MLVFEGVQRFEIDPNEIMERLPLKGDELVLLTGTIIEGIGNAQSDYDVYVVAHERPKEDAAGPHNYAAANAGQLDHFYDYLNPEGLAYDVKFLTFDQVHEASVRLDELYVESRKKTKTFRSALPPMIDDFIHKLFIGIPLQNEKAFAEVQGKFSKAKFNFLKYKNLTGAYPEWKDLAGAWMSGDIDTCLHIMHTYIQYQITGLSQLSGNSNFKPKWLMQNIRRLQSRGFGIADECRRWYHADRSTMELRRTCILRGAEIIDSIFASARPLLNSNPEFYSVEEALRLTDEEFQQEQIMDLHTRIEFEHRRRIFSSDVAPISMHLTGSASEILQYGEKNRAVV